MGDAQVAQLGMVLEDGRPGAVALPLPAELRDPEQRITEVSHNGLYRLVEREDHGMVVHSLEHLVTCEVQDLPSDAAWRLRYHGERAYVSPAAHADGEGAVADALWVNDIMRTSLWQKAGALFVVQRGVGDSLSMNWLADLRTQRSPHWVTLLSWARLKPHRLRAYRYHANRAGAKIFWDLRDLLDGMQLQSGDTESRQKRSYWVPFFEQLGIPEPHILCSRGHLVASRSQSGFYAFRAAVSTCAGIAIMLRLATYVHSHADREKATDFMAQYFATVLPNSVLQFGDLRSGPAPWGSAGSDYTVRLRDGMLSACPDLAAQLPSPLSSGWPLRDVDFRDTALAIFKSVTRRGKDADSPAKRMWQALLRQFLNSVSMEVEAQFALAQWPGQHLDRSQALPPGKRADPAMHDELRSLGEPQLYITARIASQLGHAVHNHNQHHEHGRAFKYWLALRKEFHMARTIAIFFDGKRLGGRERELMALRDGRLRRDAPGAPAAEPEATEWRRLASAFVMGAKENEREDQGEGLQRRLCRLNSYDLGVAVDWSLKSIGGEGFWQFTPEPAPQRPVELRPLLIMGCDQASPNMCLVFALLNKFKLRMIPVFCLDHRAPNDVSDAVGQIPGLRQSLLFGRVSASLNHGPWGGKANFRQIQESAADLPAKAGDDDPLIEHMIGGLQREFGDPDLSVADVKTLLSDMAWLKTPGCGRSAGRWWSDFDTGLEFNRLRHQRLLILLHLGLVQGWLKVGQRGAEVGKLSVAEPAASGDIVRKAKDTISKKRDGCKNTLHFVTTVLSDDDVAFDLELYTLAFQEERRFAGMLAHTLRSQDESERTYVALALGKTGLFESLLKTSECIQDLAGLERCGIAVNFSEKRFKQTPASSLEIVAQDMRCDRIWQFILQIIVHRVRSSFLQYRFVYPCRFAALLTDDEAELQGVLVSMKQDWQAFQKHKASTLAFHKRIVARSSFEWTLCAETFELLERNNWTMTSSVRQQVRRMVRHFGKNKIVEDAFQRITADSSLGYQKVQDSMSQVSMWMKPVERKLLSECYNFGEVSPDEIAEEGRSKLPANFFIPSYQDISIGLKEIVSKRATPEFQSFSPTAFQCLGGDTVAMTHFSEKDSIADEPQCWKSILAGPGIVLRSLAQPARYWLSLGQAGLSIVAWPLDAIRIKNTLGFKLASAPAEVFPLYDAEQFKVIPSQVRCPLWQYVQSNHKPPEEFVFLWHSRPMCSLMENAARNAFYKMSLPMLTRLAKEELGGLEVSSSLVAALMEMVTATLQCTEQDALDIVEMRCGLPKDFDASSKIDMLKSDEVLDAIDLQTCKEVSDFVSDYEKQEKSAKTIATDLLQRRKAAKGKGLKRKAVGKWNDNMMNTDVVAHLLPPEFKVFFDSFNARYRAFYKGGKASCSRSYKLRPHAQCLKEVLQWSWDIHSRMTGEPCSVSGLFDRAVAREGAVGSHIVVAASSV